MLHLDIPVLKSVIFTGYW